VRVSFFPSFPFRAPLLYGDRDAMCVHTPIMTSPPPPLPFRDLCLFLTAPVSIYPVSAYSRFNSYLHIHFFILLYARRPRKTR
jgi:hypothetical protein